MTSGGDPRDSGPNILGRRDSCAVRQRSRTGRGTRRFRFKDTESRLELWKFRPIQELTNSKKRVPFRRESGTGSYAGIATRVPSRLTDRSDTWQWMGYFLWNLNQFPSHPAVEYVRMVFDAVLDLPMYFQSELPPRLIFHPDRPYYLAGREQPADLLDRLVSATEKLHDLVIAGTISMPGDLIQPAPPSGDITPLPLEIGVTLMDAAMYFESSDERAARALVRKWHDQDVVPTESLGRCPTDGRARLYRLRDVLEKVAGANGLSKKEQSRLEQHLRSRQRTPRS